MTKTYNVAAFGIPEQLISAIARLGNEKLPLRYTRHAMREALNDRYGVLPSTSFPQVFRWSDNWSIVEAESTNNVLLTKFVVRRAVDANRSLVLVILADGTVKTLWTNLNSDNHSTLDSSKFSRP